MIVCIWVTSRFGWKLQNSYVLVCCYDPPDTLEGEGVGATVVGVCVLTVNGVPPMPRSAPVSVFPESRPHELGFILEGPAAMPPIHRNIARSALSGALHIVLLDQHCNKKEEQRGHLWRSSLRCQCTQCPAPPQWAETASGSNTLQHYCFAGVAAADHRRRPAAAAMAAVVAAAVSGHQMSSLGRRSRRHTQPGIGQLWKSRYCAHSHWCRCSQHTFRSC